jgi:hypothetical protein
LDNLGNFEDCRDKGKVEKIKQCLADPHPDALMAPVKSLRMKSANAYEVSNCSIQKSLLAGSLVEFSGKIL